jgi:hypothetical protein
MDIITKYELAPYLPYELKVKNGDKVETLNNIHAIETYMGASWYCKSSEGTFFGLKSVIPLLKPLHLFKDIEEITDEMTIREIESISDGFNVLDITNYRAVSLMFKHHIDVFNLINKGLAIDVTLLQE